MSHPASKATAVALHFIAYIPLAGVTLSAFMTLKTMVLQIMLFVDKGDWAWVKCHQAMNLGFLQVILDDRLSPFRRQLLIGAAKLANTPALVVFLGSALVCLAIGKGLQALAKAIK